MRSKNSDVKTIEAAIKGGRLSYEELESAKKAMKDGRLIQFDLFDANDIAVFANHNQLVCWAEEIEIAARSLFAQLSRSRR